MTLQSFSARAGHISLCLVAITACPAFAPVAAAPLTTKHWHAPQRIEYGDNKVGSYNLINGTNDKVIVIWKQQADAPTLYKLWTNSYTPGTGWGTAQAITREIDKFQPDSPFNAPHTATTATGHVIAIWQQQDSIWANISMEGKGWGSKEQMVSAHGIHVSSPQVAISPTGTAIAVWMQQKSLGLFDIRASRYVPGKGWGDVKCLEDNAKDARHPHIAIDSKGNAIAIWHHREKNHWQKNLWVARYRLGQGWGKAERIDTENDTGNVGEFQVAFTPTDNLFAVWLQSDKKSNSVWATHNLAADRSLGDTTQRIGTIDTKSNSSAIRYHHVQIAFDSVGKATATWQQFDGTVWLNRYIIGSGWGEAKSRKTHNQTSVPKVAVDGAGNALVAWNEENNHSWNILVSRYTVTSGWGKPERITGDKVHFASDPEVDFDANGNAIVVWRQHDGTHNSIWANSFTVGKGWTEEARQLDTAQGDAVNHQITVDTKGNATVVWRQKDGAYSQLWSARYE